MYERPPARHSFFPTVYTRDASSKAERGGVNIGVTEALRGAFAEALRGAFTEALRGAFTEALRGAFGRVRVFVVVLVSLRFSRSSTSPPPYPIPFPSSIIDVTRLVR